MKIELIIAPLLVVVFGTVLLLRSILASRREYYANKELWRGIEEVRSRIKMVEDVLIEYSKDNPSLTSLLKKKGIL